MGTDSAATLTKLHDLLGESFSLEEIRTLLFSLGVDYESVPGREKPSMIRELLLALGRQGRLDELVALARQQRPHRDWPAVPPDLELPAAAPGAQDAPVQHYNYYGDVVHGDKYTVGDISGSSGIAIGRGASATVQQGLDPAALNQLFAPLLAQVALQDPAAVTQVQQLKDEAAKGEAADDEKMADLVSVIAEAAPAAVETLVGLFATGALAKVAGAATKYVLKRVGRI